MLGVVNVAYTELLNKLIENSGLTVKEIAERCTESGVKITSAYISTLRNDKNNRSPSDEISVALAKACNAKYENILVIEAYLDKAPKELLTILNELKHTIAISVVGIFDNKLTSQQHHEIQNIANMMSLSEMIIELANEQMIKNIRKEAGAFSIKSSYKQDGIKVTQELKQAIGIEITDDGMKPIINKGNKVNFEFKEYVDYKTGDIICFAKKGSKKAIARKVVFNGDSRKKVTLLPINAEFSIEEAKAEDLIIFGKVTQVISEIK